MSFRTVVITKQCKLSYKDDYLQVKGDEINTIHLSEIGVLIVESTQVCVTAVLLAELIRRKIDVVFCDEKHNPAGVLMPLYGCHNSSKKIMQQMRWDEGLRVYVSDVIIKHKILNQSALLLKCGKQMESEMLKEYANEIEANDATNREGHAAKVYFNALFGKSFSRDENNDINAKLNYGYSIILSCVNREVVANGCLTQLGIKHCNEFNQFNLSGDIMEVFRVVVDEYVFNNLTCSFDTEFKRNILSVLNKKIMVEKEYYLTNAISVVVKSVIDALNNSDCELLKLYNFQ